MSEPRALSDAELTVLKSLWDDGDGTVRAIHERLRTQGRSWAYTTVLTLLHRLESKHCAERDGDGRAVVFRAAVSQRGYLRSQLTGLAERVCAGATTPLMLALVDDQGFSATEIDELRAELDRLAARRRAGGRTPGRRG